jgi:hypothetical protein
MKGLKKIFINNWVGILLYVGMFMVFVCSYKYGYIHGFIDYDFLAFNPSNTRDYWFTWAERRSLGEQQSIMHSAISEGVAYLFLRDILGLSMWVSIFLFKMFSFLILPVLLFSVLRTFVKYVLDFNLNNNLVWLAAFIPFINIWYFNDEWHYVFGQRFAWIIGLLLLLAINLNVGKKRYSSIFIICASLTSILAFYLVPFFIAFHFLILLYIIALLYLEKINLRWISGFYIQYILMVMPAIVLLLMFFAGQDVENSLTMKYSNDLRTYVNQGSTLSNLFKGIGVLVWDSNLGWNHTIPAFSYQHVFKGVGSVILFIPILLVIFLIFKNLQLNKKLNLIFLLGLLFCLFLAKADNKPFGLIFDYLLDNVSIANIYRSPTNKWMPVFLTILSFLFIVNVGKFNHRSLYVVLLPYYSTLLMIVGFFGIYSPSSFFILPKEYLEINNYLPENASRVLFLPERDYGKSYNFNAYVNSLEYNLGNWSVFDIGQTLGDPNNFSGSKSLLDSTNVFYKNNPAISTGDFFQMGDKDYVCETGLKSKSLTAIESELKNKGIDYLVLRKKLLGTFNEIKIADCEWLFYTTMIASLNDYSIIEDNDSFVVAQKIGSPYLTSGFFEGVEYKKYSPVLYILNNLSVDALKSKITFSKFWILYPESEFSWWEAPFLKPVADKNHYVEYGYANAWNIPKEDLERVKDENGETKLVLYFLPQTYFYYGLGVSLSTLLGLLAYIIFGCFKNKSRKKSQQ